MSASKLRIAVPTRGDGGLEDTVSEVFGRANTFTIVDVDGERVEAVDVLRNPAASYKYGAGPIVVKMLIDYGVNMVAAGELGPGASGLLEQHNVPIVTVKPGLLVAEAVKVASRYTPDRKERVGSPSLWV
ncbi:MAG: NifB/NifX family molybdenum-iron cluster-binding protein [Candidatus Bathyarchaeia archaeon]